MSSHGEEDEERNPPSTIIRVVTIPPSWVLRTVCIANKSGEILGIDNTDGSFQIIPEKRGQTGHLNLVEAFRRIDPDLAYMHTSHDGNKMLVGDNQATHFILERIRGAEDELRFISKRITFPRAAGVTSIAWSPSGHWLVMGSITGSILWVCMGAFSDDEQKYNPHCAITEDHDSSVQFIVWDADESQCFTISNDNVMIKWATEDIEPGSTPTPIWKTRISRFIGEMNTVALRGDHFAFATNKTIVVCKINYNPPQPCTVDSIQFEEDADIVSLSFNKSGLVLACVRSDNTIRMLHTDTYHHTPWKAPPSCNIKMASFSYKDEQDTLICVSQM